MIFCYDRVCSRFWWYRFNGLGVRPVLGVCDEDAVLWVLGFNLVAGFCMLCCVVSWSGCLCWVCIISFLSFLLAPNLYSKLWSSLWPKSAGYFHKVLWHFSHFSNWLCCVIFEQCWIILFVVYLFCLYCLCLLPMLLNWVGSFLILYIFISCCPFWLLNLNYA